MAVTAKSKAMRAAGVDVVGFGAGEPDFDTPAHIKEAAVRALEGGQTKYVATPGSPEVREAVAGYVHRQHGLEAAAENVLISCGGKHSLYLGFQAVCNPGDEVLLPSPYWVSYPEQAKLAGATVRAIEAGVEQGFKITAGQLADAIGPSSRVLVINSPSNPTGAMYSPDELAELAAVVAEHPDLVVFSDEIYDRLVYGGAEFVSFAKLRGDLAGRVVTFNGLSKTYAMTGWRIGFTVGPAGLIGAMAKLQGQMTSNITSFCMPAIVAALEGPQEAVEQMKAAFAKRGAHIHRRLMAISGIRCPKPAGAFYVFPDVSGVVFGKVDPGGKRLTTAQGFAESLLEHAKVAVVPGEDFGAPDHVRLSFATSMDQIDEGLDRIERYIGSLS